MSNSNYSIGLQRLKPVYTAYCGLHNLAENWSWARDVNGRDRDETLVRLETETWRPRPQPYLKLRGQLDIVSVIGTDMLLFNAYIYTIVLLLVIVERCYLLTHCSVGHHGRATRQNTAGCLVVLHTGGLCTKS